MARLDQPRLPQQEVSENWFGRKRHLIYRRTGLEAELRARAVAEETLAKTVKIFQNMNTSVISCASQNKPKNMT